MWSFVSLSSDELGAETSNWANEVPCLHLNIIIVIIHRHTHDSTGFLQKPSTVGWIKCIQLNMIIYQINHSKIICEPYVKTIYNKQLYKLSHRIYMTYYLLLSYIIILYNTYICYYTCIIYIFK